MTAHLSSLVWSALLVRTVTGCLGEVWTGDGKGYKMLFRTNCNQAGDIELTLSLEDRKALNGTGMWPPTRRKIRWGKKDHVHCTHLSSGLVPNQMAPHGRVNIKKYCLKWEITCSEKINSWVCSRRPEKGTVTYNCIPEVSNSALSLFFYYVCMYVVSTYRVVINWWLKVRLYCDFILSPEDFLSILGAHQMWSIW